MVSHQGKMLEWLKRHAWKACIRLKRIRGSNPRLSAEQVIDTKTITGSSFNELITLIILSDDQVRTVFIKQTPKRQLAFLKSARIKVKKMLPYGLSLIDGR